MKKESEKFKKGYTLLFSVLIGSLLLSIGVAILNITLKELELASVGRESQLAFYTADSGWECAFYSDRNGGFATPPSGPNTSTISCGGSSITVSTLYSQASALSSFQLDFGNACAAVEVKKDGPTPQGDYTTTISSYGRNICAGGSAKNRVERGIRMSY